MTGAARGIGKAIALKFAAEGANIAFTDLVIDKSLIKKDFSRFVKMGLMKESENKIALTSEGMLVSNLIISELL